MPKFGVYGGTFNPLHNAGIQLARKAREQFRLDKVLFVPNGNPPHKRVDVLDKEVRFELVQAGIAGEEGFEASRIEVDRPGITWTIDTLEELKRLHGAVELFFIMGEDNVPSFAKYDRRADFFKLAGLLVAPRAFPKQSSLDEWRKLLPEATIELIDQPASGLSSTEVRKLIRSGADFSDHVPAAVHRIITERGLYKEVSPETVSS
ncbi:MAG: nicotinate-nucleotide adenylyltransferase [Candidatus Obscuribacterales bacterium]|nr:nicotinate-nucleotide adenylyltransferase [Candidatus Obscuribacterales bacterium]